MSGGSLVVQSLRARPVPALLLVLISAAAVLTAVLGPMLARAVHESSLADAVAAAGPAGTAVAVRGTLDADDATAPTVEAVLRSGYDAAPQLWQDPQLFVTTSANVGWSPTIDPLPPGQTVGSRVLAAEQPCQGLVLTSGACPTTADQVVISAEDGDRHELAIGAELVITVPDRRPARLRVTGIYDGDRSDQARLLRPGTSAGQLAQVTGDPLVVDLDRAAAISLPATENGRLVLRPDAVVTVDQEATLRASEAAVRRALTDQNVVLEYDSGLPELLDRVDAQAAAADVLIAVTSVQALAVVVFTLAIVVQRTAQVRTAEWSLGRLRGVSRWRWLTTVYVEPAAAILVGAPLGLLAGTALAGAVASLELRSGTTVDPWRWPVLTAAAAALAAGWIALLATSLRTLRRPLIESIQQTTEGRRWTVPAAMAQTAVVLLAVLSVYALVSGATLGSGGSQLGLLAPAALALALAAVVVRVAVLVVARLTDRPTRSRTALVVGRRAARIPSSLNPAVVVAVGMAVALFAAQTWALSARNADLRADATVGAFDVLTVDVPRGKDLVGAVDRADPGGRFAMAVQERAGSSTGGTSRMVAVDTDRMAAVSAWSPAWSGVSDPFTALRGTRTAPVELRGTRISLTLADVRVSVKAGVSPGSGRVVDLDPKELAPPDLALVVDDGTAWTRVSFGPLRRDGALTAALPCSSPCRLVGVSLQSSPGSSYLVRFVVTGVSTDEAPTGSTATWLHDADGWRERVADQSTPQPPAGLTPTLDRRGLSIEAFDTEGGNPLTAARTDTADPMPAVIGPTVQVVALGGRDGVGFGTGLNGLSQLIAVIGRASVLPRSLDDGVLVDLRNARGLTDPAASEAVDEVWLAADAPPSVRGALIDQGLRIRSSERLSDERAALRESAATRGSAMTRWIGAAALVSSLLGLVAGRIADAARRRSDWRSLRDAGLRTGAIRGLVLIEVALPAWFGVALGTAAGVVAVMLAAGRLPLIDPSSPGPPLDLALDRTSVVVLVAVTLGSVAVIAGAAAALEGRRR